MTSPYYPSLTLFSSSHSLLLFDSFWYSFLLLVSLRFSLFFLLSFFSFFLPFHFLRDLRRGFFLYYSYPFGLINQLFSPFLLLSFSSDSFIFLSCYYPFNLRGLGPCLSLNWLVHSRLLSLSSRSPPKCTFQSASVLPSRHVSSRIILWISIPHILFPLFLLRFRVYFVSSWVTFKPIIDC